MATAAASPGLRERKKQKTRLAISEVATRLFIERGFDQVTVAEVAAAAEVSVNTIFNYFATKEELFFDRGEEVAEEPSRIVRERQPGESVIDAIRRVYVKAIKEHTGFFQPHIKPFVATIEASPALKLRERVLYDQGEQRLMQTLMAETGARSDEPTARVAAALITSVQWMLFQEFRVRLLRDEPESKIRAALLRAAERGFDVLDSGLGSYGRTRSGRRRRA
jgi:AcrR family transcriptional regulator